MDLTTAVTFSLLLVVAAGGSNQTDLDSSQENISTPSSSSTTCRCPPAPTPPADLPVPSTASPPPSLGLLTVNWTRPCGGRVYVAQLSIDSSSFPVCHTEASKAAAAAALSDVCLHKEGCKDKPTWHLDLEEKEGYTITEKGASKAPRCKALIVKCKAEVSPDVQAQLRAYKVVTALLCCLLLILLLIRFTRPTVKALQKRLSDRRQNRWIGPTQSHSVSYQRGKAAVQCNDGEKRLSYPGNTSLDRLTVSNSRDPPSNRNSYNF